MEHEIAELRGRLAEAERARDVAEQRLQLYEQRTQIYQSLILHLPIHIAIWHLEDPGDPASFRLKFVNYRSSLHQTDMDMRTQVGRRIQEVFPSAGQPLLQRYAEALRSGQPVSLGDVPYHGEGIPPGLIHIQLLPLNHDHLCISVEDVTERRRAEEAVRQSQEQAEMILAQQAALAELSTPLIPISEHVMVMPLIGAIDSRRAQQVIETLLAGISRNGAQVAILDITGVPLVDTQVANVLIQVAQSVKLLGARVVLTGIRPEVAQTLVGLGASLAGIVTLSTLQRGIAFATALG
jgi:anti-anti-sigma factor